MSHEFCLQTITDEQHTIIDPVTELFNQEVRSPWPTIMAGNGYRLYVATKDNQLVGAANVCEDLSYIRKVAVDPAHRNQGVGSALLRYAIDDMQAMGKTRVAICPTNDDNRRLYARLGFAKDPAEKLSPRWMFLPLMQPPRNGWAMHVN